MKYSLSDCLSILKNGIASVPRASPEYSPPPYSEIAKKSRDLFNKGYYFGILALDVRTRSNNNVEIATLWTENIEESKLHGTIELRYHLDDYSLAITEKLNKNFILNTELRYRNKLFDGLAFTFGGTSSLRSGLQIGLLKAEWSSRFCYFNTDFEIGNNFTFITSSCVLGYRSVFGGAQWRYDVHNDRQADLNFTIGYSSQDFYVYSYVNNGRECGGSVWHKVEPQLEIGVDFKWWTYNPMTFYQAAARYEFSKNVSGRGKINNASELGLSYEQKLSKDIKLAVSALFDLKNVVVGKHKFGLGLQLEL